MIGQFTFGLVYISFFALVTAQSVCTHDSVAVGVTASYASDTEHTLYVWGSDPSDDGILGFGQDVLELKEPQSLTGYFAFATSVKSGNDHVCVCDQISEEIWCWGSNEKGKLGYTSTTTKKRIPLLVLEKTGLIDVAVGSMHTCSLTKTSDVSCVGDNSFYQLTNTSLQAGFSTDYFHDVTGSLADQAEATSIHASFTTTCVVGKPSGLHCWGENRYGAAGIETTGPYVIDATLISEDSIISMDMGGLTTATSCYVTTFGEVKCFGDNQFGTANPWERNVSYFTTPTIVENYGLDNVGVTVGSLLTCVTKVNGTTYCYGSDESQHEIMDQKLNTTSKIKSMDLSNLTGCFVTEEGQFNCWGNNYGGRVNPSDESSPELTYKDPIVVLDTNLAFECIAEKTKTPTLSPTLEPTKFPSEEVPTTAKPTNTPTKRPTVPQTSSTTNQNSIWSNSSFILCLIVGVSTLGIFSFLYALHRIRTRKRHSYGLTLANVY